MKKSTLLPLLCLAAALPLLWTGCKKDPPCDDPLNPECPNYDRCLTVPKTNAEFIVSNWTSPGEVPLPFRDTIPFGGIARLDFRVVNRDMSRYEWKIGHDPRVFTDTTFFLVFENISGWVNFSLTVYNDKADTTCYPGDSGVITVQKSFYFKPYFAQTHEDIVAQYPIFGTYLGYPEGRPQDTSRITIAYPRLLAPVIYNMIQGCPEINSSTYYNTHYFVVNGTVGPNQQTCHNPYVFADLASDNKSLRITYAVTQHEQRVEGKWIGQKIN